MSDPDIEFYSRIADDIPTDKKYRLFQRHAENLGFDEIYYGRRVYNERHQAEMRGYQIWDPVWKEIYDGENYVEADWAMSAIRNVKHAFRFEVPQREMTAAEQAFTKDARHHGRLNGFAVPLATANGLVSGLSATSRESRPTDEQINRLIAASKLFDHVMAAHYSEQMSKTAGLTEREVQLVRLLCDGYSFVQMAHATGRSDQWIRKSFMIIREKLGVNNNNQVLVKAMSMGLLR
ncbi:MAG: autoinducer binding domain-containing protein [Henriciella sp.]|nr:autoinducer binding domain-containing protein [Henriciella sp.]